MEAIALMSIQRGRDSRGQSIFINPDEYLVAEGEELAHLLANNAVREATPDEIILATAKGKRPPAPQPVVPVETQYAPVVTESEQVVEPVTTPETTVETVTSAATEQPKPEAPEVKEPKVEEAKASKPAKGAKKAASKADEDDLEI